MFGLIVVMRLFREKKILTQVCGNNFMALKVAPPLIVTEAQADYFVRSIGEVMELVHSSGSFWSDALQLAARAVNI
jgi:ornithine--oxo-acid transaminase